MLGRGGSERQAAQVAIAMAALLFLVLIALGGPFFESFDEAKYVGLGRSLFAGQGYATVFGSAFLTHPPGWPLILAAPEVALGVDPFAWGRILNALSGAGLIVMAGWIGWRVRPAVGAIAAMALLALPYLSDLSRGARLDVPGATISVLAVAVGVIAVERGSSRRGVVAGALFAIAFLIKETSLALVAVPAIAGIVVGQRPATIARVNAWLGLALSIGGAWWFAFVAAQSGLVYRTSLPAWTLIPGAIALGLAIAGGLAAERLAAPRAVGRNRDVAAGPMSRHRLGLGIGLSIGWAAILLLVLARSPELGTAGLFDRTQVAAWLRAWGSTIRAPALFIVGGAIAAAVATIVDRQAARRRATSTEPTDLPQPIGVRAAAVLTPALLASLPLLLFVVAIGEPPRNDFAPLAFGAALGAAGWLAILERLFVARSPIVAGVGGLVIGAVGGLTFAALNGLPSFRVAAIGGGLISAAGGGLVSVLRRRSDGSNASSFGPLGWLARNALPLALGTALIASTGALAVHVRRTPGTAATAPRAQAVRAITAWVRGNEPRGTPIAVGSLLGNEVAIELGGYPIVKLSAVQAGVAKDAPLGLTIRPGDQLEDWLSIDSHPRKTDQFLVFEAAATVAALRTTAAPVWIYVSGESTAAPSIVGALTPDNGFTVAEHWTWPTGGRPLEGWVFRIDPSRLGFAGAPIRIEPGALQRLVFLLAKLPDGSAIAARLKNRILIAPDGSAARQAEDALTVLAGGG